MGWIKLRGATQKVAGGIGVATGVGIGGMTVGAVGAAVGAAAI